MITHNFRLGFSTSYFVSISYDSSSQGGYSSLMLIQLLYKCFISPSLDFSAIQQDFSFTLTYNRVTRIILSVLRKYIRQYLSIQIGKIFSNYQVTTTLSQIALWASNVYPLFCQSHRNTRRCVYFPIPNCQKTNTKTTQYIYIY